MRVRLLVQLTLPPDATHEQARRYVETAVRHWAGGLEPPGTRQADDSLSEGDPMFDLDPERVQVTTAQ